MPCQLERDIISILFLKMLENCVGLERKRVRVIELLDFFMTDYIFMLMNSERYTFIMRDSSMLRKALANGRLDLTLIDDVMKKLCFRKRQTVYCSSS